MLVKITDGKPVPYSITALRRDNPQVSFPASLGPENLAEFGVYEADIVDAAPSRFHSEASKVALIQNGRALVSREWKVTPLADAKAQAVAELSRIRDAKIERGFPFEGVTAPCDDKSIGRYTAAYVLAKDNPDMKRNWKLPTGFVELGADQLMTLATAAADFVQTCFDEQKAHVAAVEAAKTVEEIEAVLSAAE